MSRKQAREIALHLIFEMGFREFEEERLEERLDSKVMESLSEEGDMYGEKPDEAQLAYIRSVVKGVAADRKAIDSTIEKYAKGRKVGRMSRMTVAILRLAIYEMRSVDDVPERVAINEAVELSKTYAAEESAKFINGILGSISRANSDELQTLIDAADESAKHINDNLGSEPEGKPDGLQTFSWDRYL